MEIQEVTTNKVPEEGDESYQLELKPYEGKHGDKCKVLEITDITLHSSKKRPSSISKKVRKAFKDDAPGRVYSPVKHEDNVGEDTVTVDFLEQCPDFVQMVKGEQEKGYKVLIMVPGDGIPVLVGKDTQDFFKSKRGRRIIRKRTNK